MSKKLIQINLEVLIYAKLTSDEYILLKLLYDKDYNYILMLHEQTLLESLLLRLERKGYIKWSSRVVNNEGDLTKITLRVAAIDLFEISNQKLENCWSTFKSIYPVKQGDRRLHDQQDNCKKKFLNLIKDDLEVFHDIIKGLNNELALRKKAELKRQFFPAMKTMSAWINQKNYLTYLDDIIDEDTSNERVEKG
jgi:hypothetical protein